MVDTSNQAIFHIRQNFGDIGYFLLYHKNMKALK